MATRASWAILHPKPYRKGPTPDSVRRAADLDRPLDIDIRLTRDGRQVGAHNRVPGSERYRYTKESVQHGIAESKVDRLVMRPIDQLHSDVVWTLRTRTGDRYWPVSHLVEVAGEVDAKLEFEPKVPLSVEELEDLKGVCVRAYGADRWRQMTWLKKLTRIFGRPVPWRTLLGQARGIGFRTIALRVRTDFIGRRLPTNYYRK